MNLKVIHSEKRLCTCCMKEHEVKTVCVMENICFKDIPVEYEATYFYCDAAEELYMEEGMIIRNDIAMKDAYRKQKELLTSKQISSIREKYGISQSDLCLLLGWDRKTIACYESHQVQDGEHDAILKKLDRDPEWFLHLLSETRESLSAEAYHKYLNTATML